MLTSEPRSQRVVFARLINYFATSEGLDRIIKDEDSAVFEFENETIEVYCLTSSHIRPAKGEDTRSLRVQEFSCPFGVSIESDGVLSILNCVDGSIAIEARQG